MSSIPKMVDSIPISTDVAANRFVGIDGTVGTTKYYGITQYGGKAGKTVEVIALGIGEVEVATGETIAAGNMVSPDADGKAVLDASTGKFMAKTGGTAGDLIEIVIR